MNREPPRWLLLIHQIPPKPDYLRVKVWRRLQALGAVAIKNSVYVLPSGDAAREDFQWVQKEIEATGGEASVCEARFVNGLDDSQVRALFNAARDSDYAQLADELREAVGDAGSPERRDDLRARHRRLQKRLSQIAALDFFAASGRLAVEPLLLQLDAMLKDHDSTTAPAKPPSPLGCIWVTRPGVGVDRMASAWLIRRFIDPQARFGFAEEDYEPRPGELRFDMVAAEYTHEGDRCTFEVLLERFGLAEAALGAIGRIIHDLDLKDGKFRPDEGPGIATVLAGIAATQVSDAERLQRADVVLDALRVGLIEPLPVR